MSNDSWLDKTMPQLERKHTFSKNCFKLNAFNRTNDNRHAVVIVVAIVVAIVVTPVL